MPESTLSVGGIVLCGGKSERFRDRFGQPKQWLDVGGETLLARTVRVVSEAVSPVVVVAAPGEDVPPWRKQLPTILIRDPRPHLGPVCGLWGGLLAMRGQVDAAFVAACDHPRLHADFIRGMIGLLGNFDIAAPKIDGVLHPLTAVYRLEVLSVLERILRQKMGERGFSGDYSPVGPRFLCENSNTRYVTQDEIQTFDPRLDCLKDIDDWSDWQKLQQTPPIA